METVLEFDRAFEVVLRAAGQTRPSGTEQLPLLESYGRVLAVAVLADRDQPPFDRSTRDGFALRAGGSGKEWRVIGELKAGEVWTGAALGAEDAVEIMTGAPLPPGADAVVMFEHATLREEGTLILDEGRRLLPGANVVPRGAELLAGATALPAGVTVRAAEIAVAASVGATDLVVNRRPRVAILATGDELVEIAAAPEPQQIRNSNSYALAALVAEAGGDPVRLPIVPDRLHALRTALDAARGCDLIVLSGGVSMGKYDLVETVLTEAGAEFFFTGVRMQPGKPVVFGTLPASGAHKRTLFFGLPGNPVSAQVTFLCFVAPVIRAMGGSTDLGPRFVQATLEEEIEPRPGLTRLLPAHLTSDPRHPSVRRVPWQGSGDLRANARATCYVVLPGDHARPFARGEVVSVLLR